MIEKVEIHDVKKEKLKLIFTMKDNRGFLLQSILGDNIKRIEALIKDFGFPRGINKFYAFKYGKGKDYLT